MNKVLQLDEKRPHVTIAGKKSVHVIPLIVFERIIAGTMLATEVDDINDFLPTIIGEWLEAITYED